MHPRRLRRLGVPFAVLSVLVIIGVVTMAGARGVMEIAEDTGQSVVGTFVVSDEPCGARRAHPGPDGPPTQTRGQCEEPEEPEEDPIPPEVLEARAEECRKAVGDLPSAPMGTASEVDHAIARVLELCRSNPDSPGLLEALQRLAEHRAHLNDHARTDEPYRVNAVIDESRVLEG